MGRGVGAEESKIRSDLGFRVQGSGFRVQGPRVQDSGDDVKRMDVLDAAEDLVHEVLQVVIGEHLERKRTHATSQPLQLRGRNGPS